MQVKLETLLRASFCAMFASALVGCGATNVGLLSSQNNSQDDADSSHEEVSAQPIALTSLQKAAAASPKQEVSAADPCAASSKTEFRREVCKLVNAQRAKKGLLPTRLDSELSSVAQKYADQMNKQGFFGHVSPSGATMLTRLDEAGVTYNYAGENIAKGQKSSEEVMQGWMDSKGHRKNIMNENYRRLGVGLAGKVWVQVFTD